MLITFPFFLTVTQGWNDSTWMPNPEISNPGCLLGITRPNTRCRFEDRVRLILSHSLDLFFTRSDDLKSEYPNSRQEYVLQLEIRCAKSATKKMLVSSGNYNICDSIAKHIQNGHTCDQSRISHSSKLASQAFIRRHPISIPSLNNHSSAMRQNSPAFKAR